MGRDSGSGSTGKRAGKKTGKKTGPKGGAKPKGGAQPPGGAERARNRPAVSNDFREGRFAGPAQGSGVQKISYVERYAPVPTALDAVPGLPPEFTGRDVERGALLDLLDPEREQRETAPAVAVIAGPPGVGKTTLAYAVAHAAQDRKWFTGVMLVDLRGYDPRPARAGDVLDALLRSLGVRPKHIPPEEADRAALYRSQLKSRTGAGERLLVIADNASSVEQTRPLLPPDHHHALLVTSRSVLPGIGRQRPLDLLSPGAATTLLDAALRQADPEDSRVADDREAALRVARACGHLPLALQITAALLITDPGQPLAERAERLSGAEDRLDGLDDGERSVRATFDQSLQSLLPQQADLFRRLSLNPGPDISTRAAALLNDTPEPVTERLLSRLATAHLVARGEVRGRWQMHDLLRDYAADRARAATRTSRPTRRRYEQALARLREYYARTAEAATTHVPGNGIVPDPGFADWDEAMSWLDAERSNLLALALSEESGTALVVNRSCFALMPYLAWQRRFEEAVAVSARALDICRATGDHNEAIAWNNFGLALQDLRRYDEALAAHTTARDLHHQHNVPQSEAIALNSLGLALQALRRYDEALAAHTTARDLHHQHNDPHSEANTWVSLGITLQALRRYEEALAAHTTARDLHHQHNDPHSEAIAWNNLGTVLQKLRRYDEALAAHTTALDLYRGHKDPHREAIAWNNLGTVRRDKGDHAEAVAAGTRSAAAFAGLNDPYREGEALKELATTLAAAGRPRPETRDTWLRSAAAYGRATAAEKEAAASLAEADRLSESEGEREGGPDQAGPEDGEPDAEPGAS
ncbi:tetratricopeptide repeat protein [Streptomyces sp. NPDC007088]|uniref:tetratricopeptide repeat protein n=1 Tax=Streptomyces sp. NPDC007088 TaxID=3364773 RepID=UPI0036C1E9B3